MTFYPQFPAIYAYPMPFPNQDFYMYPPGSGGGVHADAGGTIYYDPTGTAAAGNPNHPGQGHHHQVFGSPGSGHRGGSFHHHFHSSSHKHGYNNRKDSADSGISEFSNVSGRKTSSTSTISNASIMEEPQLDDVKEETPFEEPDDDLCEKIVQQVEFYFSDANITKDKFLLKHVKRNKEGFVSLKLISSFKRVKHLTKDWRQVAHAIERKSDKLEVNDVKTKVRRLEALPEYDETTPSRTVVALQLPLDRPTIEAVAEIFSTCGDIVLVRILRPGNPIPADIKPFVNKHPEMTAKVCALVEFERTEFALEAVRELNNEEEDKMKVMELTAPPAKAPTKKDGQKKSVGKLQQHAAHSQQGPQQQQQQLQVGGVQRRFSHAGFHIPQHQNPDQLVLGPRRRISLLHNMKFAPITEEEHQKQKAEHQFALNPNAPTFQMQQQHQHQRRLSRPSFMPPPMSMEASVMQMQLQQSPWMIRRLSHGDFAAAAGLTLPPNVIRLPRGPDKSKGFQRWCRSRMEGTKKSHAVPIVAPPPEPGKPKTKKAEDEVASVKPDETVEAETVQAEAVNVDQVVPQESATEPAEGDAAAAGAAVSVAQIEAPPAAGPSAGDSGSDSGHEDGALSEQELELVDNERSR